jgi:sugar lactone lactonase YvrE
MGKQRDLADGADVINFIDGLTSSVQTQLDNKATLDGSPTFTGTVTASSFSGDGSSLTGIDGLTSSVQTQLDNKATLDGSPTFTGTVTASSFSGDGSSLTGIDSLPSQSGQSGKYLSTNGTVPSWVTLTTDPTLGTLTKTFTTGESSTINLTSSVLAPVVSVTKEVPQSGVTNNNWDVNSTTENYTRLNSAYATTLDWVGYGIAQASFVDSFSVSSQETTPFGFCFSADGSKMFVTGTVGDDVNEYALSTSFDVSTATYTQAFSVVAQENNPQGIAFNTDGTKMFIVGVSGDDVNEYTLSTGFDVSTASFVDSFSLAGQETTSRDIKFNTDGTKMFVVGEAGDDINEYTLSTGFDVSTASFTTNFSVASEDTTPRGLAFNSNGTKMFVGGTVNSKIFQYSLSTAFDISTASYDSIFFNDGTNTVQVNALAFNTDGTKLFFVSSIEDAVYEYTIPLSLTLGTGSFASADVGKTIEANSGVFVLTATDGSYAETTAPTSYAQVASGSWEMYGVVYNAADGDLELSYGIIDKYDISTSIYSQNFSVLAEETTPTGIFFKPDGTKMYISGDAGNDINEYDLTTAFDVSTASFLQSFSVSGQEGNVQDVTFSPDGTKMFIVGFAQDNVHRYLLSTAWDVSTASFSQTYSVAGQETTPQGLTFNPDGTKMFVVGQTGDDVNEYTLATGFDLTSVTFEGSFLVDQDGNPTGVAFDTTGFKMFVIGNGSDNVREYLMNSSFSMTGGGSYVQAFSIVSEETSPQGVTFNSDGAKMFIIGGSRYVHEYSLGTKLTPTGYHPVHTTNSIDSTYWTDINSMTADQAAGDGNVYYAISTDDRTTWTVIDNTDGERDIVRNNAGTWQYNSNGTYASETWVNGATNTELATIAEAMEGASVSVGFDVSTSVFVDSFSLSTQDTVPLAVAFNTNGTKMFVTGNTGDSVYEYTLSTGFDVSTSSYSQSFSVASQETTPNGIAFNTDGTKMFIVGNVNNTVYEYALTTGFDVSTASYSQSFSVASQETNLKGIAFNTDGTKMFIVGHTGDDVNEYTLSTGFDVSTATFVDSFSVAAQHTAPNGIAFNTDGTKMFIVGSNADNVSQYTLSTGFDVSTASYINSFSVAGQETNPTGLAFNTNGTKMFIVGWTGDSVYEYTVGTTTYTNQMDKTQLDAVTDPNHIALGDDLDLSIIFNMTSGSTVPSSDGVAINYDANVLNKGAVLGTDYDFDAPAGDEVRVTALTAGNFKVRVV